MKTLRPYLTALLVLLALPAGPGAASAQGLEGESGEAASFFDGAGKYTGTAAAGASAQDKARLLAALKTRVTINDRGVPAEGTALNSMLSRILDTPTGRELAAKFIQEDAKATISFDSIPGTKIFTLNGKKTFWASGGNAHARNNPPLVHMNSGYLEANQEDAPGTLAHELFGHVLEGKRSERYGVEDIYNYNENEEANACLVGWTVSAELGNKMTDHYAWVYMRNPAEYQKQLKSNMASYNRMLTAEQMKDPLPVYQARRLEVDKLLLRLPGRKDNITFWQKVIDHLVTLHKMIADSFRSVKEAMDASLASIPADMERLTDIKDYLNELIDSCSGDKSAVWLATLKNKSDNAYFKEQEKVMAERQKILAGLMLGRSEKGEQTPPPNGQATWDDVQAMWDKDRKTCGWKP